MTIHRSWRAVVSLACAYPLIIAWDNEQDASLRKGDILVSVTGQHKPGGRVEAAVDVPVGAVSLWNLMLDCAGAPKFVPKMKQCRVLESAPDASTDLREQRLQFLPGFADLTLRFRSHYAPPHEIRFVKEGGDLAVMEGVWRIEPLGPASARLHYQADMATKTPFPGALVRDGMRRDTLAILAAVRQEAIRRTGALSPPVSETEAPW